MAVNSIKINIFKYVDYPINLALACQNCADPYAKSEWLVVCYGKAHALFHAARLGPTFINIPVCQALIARNVIVSRCFIQTLLIHFGNYDQKSLDLFEHNFGQRDIDRIRAFLQKVRPFWASNVPTMSVLTFLLVEGYRQLSNASEDLPSKGNDLIHFSAEPYVMNYALRMLRKKRFIPFPPIPK